MSGAPGEGAANDITIHGYPAAAEGVEDALDRLGDGWGAQLGRLVADAIVQAHDAEARAEAAEADLRKALDAAMEAAKQDEANLAKVTALEAEAARLLFMFEDASHMAPGEPFATITSPEPWRAMGRFMDEHFGGTAKARAALDRQEP